MTFFVWQHQNSRGKLIENSQLRLNNNFSIFTSIQDVCTISSIYAGGQKLEETLVAKYNTYY